MKTIWHNTNEFWLALLDANHAPTETVLTRFCGNVAKVNGDRIDEEQLAPTIALYGPASIP